MPDFAEGDALNVNQQALYLQVNRDTIRAWKKAGYLPDQQYLTPAQLREGRAKVPPKRHKRTKGAASEATGAPDPDAPAVAPAAPEHAAADPPKPAAPGNAPSPPAKPVGAVETIGAARVPANGADLDLPPGPKKPTARAAKPAVAAPPAPPASSSTLDVFEGWR